MCTYTRNIMYTHANTNDLVKSSLHKGPWRMNFFGCEHSWLIRRIFVRYELHCDHHISPIHQGEDVSAIPDTALWWSQWWCPETKLLESYQCNFQVIKTMWMCMNVPLYILYIGQRAWVFYLDTSGRGASAKKITFLPWHWCPSSKSTISREIKELHTLWVSNKLI